MVHSDHSWSNLALDFDNFFFPGVVPINAKAAELKFWTKNDGQVWTVNVFLPLGYDVLRF